jgi:hypothetical protein
MTDGALARLFFCILGIQGQMERPPSVLSDLPLLALRRKHPAVLNQVRMLMKAVCFISPGPALGKPEFVKGGGGI